MFFKFDFFVLKINKIFTTIKVYILLELKYCKTIFFNSTVCCRKGEENTWQIQKFVSRNLQQQC